MEVVFSDLLYHDLAAIPIGELELSLPPIICYTATLMCASHLLEIVRFFYNNSITYEGFVSRAACETAAVFIVNGSSRNLDYRILKKLGVYTATHRYRNYLTLSEFLSDPRTPITSDIDPINQFSLNRQLSVQLSKCTEFWVSVTHHYTSGLLVDDAVSIILKSFQNDLLTQAQCTENAFIYSTLPSTKITDTHFLYSHSFEQEILYQCSCSHSELNLCSKPFTRGLCWH